jgi:hypothetical protein
MRSEITADVVEGQIVTATGLLQWIQAEAEKTRRASGVAPLLGVLTILLGSIISTMRKKGIENFDPEHAGYAAAKLWEVSEAIRVLIAGSDISGLYDRFPSSRLLKKVQSQGRDLSKIANALNLIDEKWQITVAQAAKERISLARQIALSTPEESIELFDEVDESCEGPSEEAVRAQFHRTAGLHSK